MVATVSEFPEVATTIGSDEHTCEVWHRGWSADVHLSQSLQLAQQHVTEENQMGQDAGTEDSMNEYGLDNGPSHDVFPVTMEQEDIIDDIMEQSANVTLGSMYAPWVINMGENARRGGTNRRSVADFRLPPERDKETL